MALGMSVEHISIKWFHFMLQQLSQDFSSSQGTDSSAMSSVSGVYERSWSYSLDSHQNIALQISNMGVNTCKTPIHDLNHIF